jgi:hypothetical protein
MTEITAHHGLFEDTKLYVDDTCGTGRRSPWSTAAHW